MNITIGNVAHPIYELSFQWPQACAWNMRIETSAQAAVNSQVQVVFSGISVSGHIGSCVERRPGLWAMYIIGGVPGLTVASKRAQQWNASLRTVLQTLAKQHGISLAPESRYSSAVLPWLVPAHTTFLQVLQRSVSAWHMKLNGEICIGNVWPDAGSAAVAPIAARAIVRAHSCSTAYSTPYFTFIPLTENVRSVSYVSAAQTWTVVT